MSSETLQWEIEGFNHRAQGRRRVYWVRVVDPLGDNRFRPAIQRGAVTFYCDCHFHKLEDAKRFCQSDHDSIQEVCDEDNQTLRTRLAEVEGELAEKEKVWAKIFTDLKQNHQSLLERLKEAEVLLNETSQNWWSRYDRDWRSRRDAFLNPTNKDVK